MMSNEPEAIEGQWSGGLVVMKFPDAEKARVVREPRIPGCPKDSLGLLDQQTRFCFPALT
jgi:hypothetical protein